MNKTILIVEDDPDVRLGYSIRLAANNYDTVFASDGLGSITQAQNHKPDLILWTWACLVAMGSAFWRSFRQFLILR